MTCFDSQVIQRLTAIRLDSCGRIPLTGDDPAPAIKGLKKGIQTLTKTRQIDLPTATVTKTIDGGTCTKPRPNPTDRGFSYGLTFCGGNPIFEVAAGYKTLDMDGADIIGWEDVNVATQAKLALEIVFTPSTDTCEAGEDALCIAVIVPMLEQWVRSGDETYNGDAVPDLVMTGQTTLSRNLFSNYTALTLPGYLAHWAPKFDDIATGRSWQYTRFIECPVVDPLETSCEFTALTAPVS